MSDIKKIIDADQIHLLQIKTLKAKIESEENNSEEIERHQFNFEISTGLATDQKIIGLKLTTEIQAVDIDDKLLTTKGSYTHELIFRVDNLADFVSKEGKQEKLDMGFGSTMVGIVYSTVRGIIFSRTQGSALGSVILPVMPPLRLMGLEDKLAELKAKAANEKVTKGEVKDE